MRSIWKGSVGFGLINVPSKLYSAHDKADISFNQIHPDCKGRIKLQTYCPQCDRVVERNTLKKGYELSENNYIILDDSDLQSLSLKSLKSLEILGFTKDAITPLAYDSVYFLSPDKGGEKAFALLYKTMEKLQVKAIGKLVYREREHLACVVPYGGIMLCQTLHYASEIRDFTEIKPREMAIGDKELQLAETLISQMTMIFDLNSFANDYRKALEAMIEAKIEGKILAPAPEAPAPAGDLADMLIKSLNLAGVK